MAEGLSYQCIKLHNSHSLNSSLVSPLIIPITAPDRILYKKDPLRSLDYGSYLWGSWEYARAM